MTALPACWAFASYLVSGLRTEIGSRHAPLGPDRRAQPRLQRRRPRRSARRSRRGRWRRAASRPACSRSAIRATRRRLQQSALVVAGLRPRVREEHPHAGQRSRRHHVLEHVDAVAPDQPDVGRRPRGRRRRATGPALAGRPRPRSRRGPARPCAIASVEMPAPQPISRITGADRPNHAAVSIRAAGAPVGVARICMPSSGHSRSQVSCWPPERAERRDRTTLVMRGKGW